MRKGRRWKRRKEKGEKVTKGASLRRVGHMMLHALGGAAVSALFKSSH